MIGPTQQYWRLLEELGFERRLSGGTLSQEAEARFAGELDRCWQGMTEDERGEAERRFAEQFGPPVS